MFSFSQEVDDVLRQTGWSPTRAVPTHRWVNPLVAVGYKPFPAALRILENLGGLKITPPTSEANRFFPGEVVFDPVFASSEFDRVVRWQRDYDLVLFPVGEYDPVFMMLCSDDGRIFGAREDTFNLLGETIEDALALRIFARRLPSNYAKVHG